MEDILTAIINASERAASVARSCCSDSAEVLLVAEKGEKESNARFEKDFKTIADVLAQESAKYVIASQFPELAEHIRGEECPEMNGIRICLKDNVEQTAKLLSSLVSKNLAINMAKAAHSDTLPKLHKSLPKNLPFIDISDLGFWIDPIDATAEFIAGVRGEIDSEKGLPCVTVLIGAYLRSTGEPVMGVINQPFFNSGEGHVVWGIYHKNFKMWSENISNNYDNIILISGAEKPEVVNKIKNAGWIVQSVPGAGHKLLKVILGQASAYLLSNGTTFRWDTCAPHAILKAIGGDIVSYQTQLPITYHDPNNLDSKYYCNSEGIIAYSNAETLRKINLIFE